MKKISELKCPSDDEFAEYIIVMLQNNKSEADLQEELAPFLSTQTAVFVSWLFGTLSPETPIESWCFDDIYCITQHNAYYIYRFLFVVVMLQIIPVCYSHEI